MGLFGRIKAWIQAKKNEDDMKSDEKVAPAENPLKTRGFGH